MRDGLNHTIHTQKKDFVFFFSIKILDTAKAESLFVTI